MSDDRELVLAKQAEGFALQCLADEIVKMGRAAADSLTGLIVQTEDDAAMLADQLGMVKKAEKRLRDLEAAACAPYKGAITAIQARTSPARNELAKAAAAGNQAALAWTNLQRQRQREEEARLRREADEAAKRAAEEAEVLGEEPPPPLDVVAPAPPSVTRGGAHTIHTQKRLACELVNHVEAESEWLTLKSTLALEAFRSHVRGMGLSETEQVGESIVWKGVRFFYQESVVSR